MIAGKDLWYQFESLFNKRDWAGVASLFTSDGIYVGPNLHHQGPEVIEVFLDEVCKAASDIRIEASLVIAEGDTIVAEWTYRSSHTVPITNPDGTETAAMGTTLEFPGVSIGRLSGEKFATLREYYDNASVMSQLGLMPGA